MKKKLFSAMGLMSGTSMDGVDVSIIKSDGYDEIELIFDQYFEYDIDFYRQLSTLREKIKSSEDLTKYSKELSDLERALTIFHAEKISKIVLKNESNIGEDTLKLFFKITKNADLLVKCFDVKDEFFGEYNLGNIF